MKGLAFAVLVASSFDWNDQKNAWCYQIQMGNRGPSSPVRRFVIE